ncbi:hypothetical protein ACN47E_007692 [Coniothyrium glycines]
MGDTITTTTAAGAGDAAGDAAPPSHTRTYPVPQPITPHLTLQAPLSRRGRGPGLILVLDNYALVEGKGEEVEVDPQPLKKWAEEGFAVVQMIVPGKVDDGGEFPLKRALEVLEGCKECEFEKGVGVISYLTRIPYYVEEAACQHPSIKALVSYGGKKFTSLSQSVSTPPPQLLHISGPETPRRESFSIVPNGPSIPTGVVKTYRYEDAKRDTAWVVPGHENYHKRSAGLAHTRSLAFLKPLLNGPFFDLEAIWEEHTKYAFAERNVDETMATMVEQPYVNHIPTMTGGIGAPALKAFYTQHLPSANQASTTSTLVSRTLGTDRLVDESVLSLTHTSHVPWLLPGVPPTRRELHIPATAVVGVRGDRVCHVHISWDHATVLRQVGLLPESGAVEVEDAGRVEVRVPVVGAEGARKLVDEGCEESNGLITGSGVVG